MTKRQNLTIRQGETWSYIYTWLDSAGSAIDLTGYTARMSIKADFDSSNEAYLSTGSDADGGTIALGGALGTVTMSMTATQSAALAGGLNTFLATADYEQIGMRVKFKYDCELVSSGGAVTRILEGAVVVQREITT